MLYIDFTIGVLALRLDERRCNGIYALDTMISVDSNISKFLDFVTSPFAVTRQAFDMPSGRFRHIHGSFDNISTASPADGVRDCFSLSSLPLISDFDPSLPNSFKA